MRSWLLLFLLPVIHAVPRESISFTGFKVNYNPVNHNNDPTVSLVDYLKHLSAKIKSFFAGEEDSKTTVSWTERPDASTTTPLSMISSTPATFWFGTHWKWPTQRRTTTPSTMISWNREQPGKCPSRVDAYVDVKNSSLLFQDNKVYVIQNNSVTSSFQLDSLFSDLKFVTAGLYNKDKELLILFSERSVWGFLWFDNDNTWKIMDDYPKNLPDSIPFTPFGAIRWIDDSQVLLSEDGRLAIYDEVLNEPLTTGSTLAYLKGLPEKIKGASRWTEKGSVRIFTEKIVFDYNKSTQEISGKPLTEFLTC